MLDRRVFSIIVLIVMLVGIPGLGGMRQAQGQVGACEALVSRALSDLGTQCAGVGANRVCYGFPTVTATGFGEAGQLAGFAKQGDQVDLAQVGGLITSPFSSQQSQWGIALLRVQLGTRSASANKSTVYMLMGDAQITNLVPPADAKGPKKDAPVPMQVLKLQTGTDSTECINVPPSSLVVQSPSGMTVTITVNEVPIELSSTVILRSRGDNQLQVITGNGKAVLFPKSPTRVEIPAGVSVDVTKGDNEVEWRSWRVMSQDEWDRFAELENVPQNVLPERYFNPAIISPSGVGQPQPQVQLPSGITRPIPPTGRPFPLIAMHTGRPGRDLDAPAWTPVTLGEGQCAGDLLFHSNRTNDWDLFALDPATGEAANVTLSPSSADIEPSISPDCQWVAFVSNRDPQGSWEIYLSKVDGSQVQRLTFNTGIDVNPVWGPDGVIVFESNRDRNWELYMVDVTGDGVPVRLTEDDATDMGAFWFPDGEHIVFESDRDGDWELFKLNVVTGELTQLTNNDTTDRLPVVSHNGALLAWLQTDEAGVENLWVMDVESGEAQQLTDTGYSVGGPVFAPDDSFLVFHAFDAGGDSEIFALDLASGAIKALTANSVDDRAPTFRGDSSQVVFQSVVDDRPGRPGQYELFIVDPLPLDGPANAPVRLTVASESDDIFAVGDPRDESNTRPNLILDVMPR